MGESIKKVDELLEVFSGAGYPVSYAHAKATNTCIRCGRSAERFRDASVRLEYAVSALCEGCQDEFLNQREVAQ